MNDNPPLVSIGVPTCNRARLLEQALASLLAQDYPRIEIIVSDNLSDDDTPAVCERLARQHSCLRHVRQRERVPPMANFRLALTEARGELFMWAADDDLWEPRFISTLVPRLVANSKLVLAMCEAQYRLPDGPRLPFFPEGTFWHRPLAMSRFERLMAVADHNYGDLIYGIYRREVLFKPDGGTVLDHWTHVNEIPMFLAVAARGEIAVVPEVHFLKTVGVSTYLVASREYEFYPPASQLPGFTDGGWLRRVYQRLRAVVKWPKLAIHHWKYSRRAWRDIVATIDMLDLTAEEHRLLHARFRRNLRRHWLKQAFWWQFEDAFLPRKIV